jgi:uncharacterized protein YdaU (DUF1376 family)
MYIGDEVMDTKGLSIETRGALYSLSLHYFHKGGLPKNDRMVQRIADVPTRKWHAVEIELKTIFTPDWRHPRWDRILGEMASRRRQAREAGRASGAARRQVRPGLRVVAQQAEPASPSSFVDDDDMPF